jgi:CheY-like chemotaxis protein
MILGMHTQSTAPRNVSRTILVIEDEEALSSLLKTELTSLGYRVAVARDGHDGLRQIQNVEPDLIICDRAMPHMTGSQLLERLRGAYPQYSSIPFIFLTALTDQRDKAAVQSLQPFAYLEKPLDFNLLQKTIEKAFGS